VNFVTAHDGFTLNDLVSYNDKHNEANGEDNRDGHSNNHSWNHGVEGPTDDPEIRGLRERQKRNLLGTVLLSQGTPMVLAGDELGRTQKGNNNTYCQDNELNWIDWANIGEDGQSLIEFTRRLIALRQTLPILRRQRFLTGRRNEELDVSDVLWVSPSGEPMRDEQWEDPNARCLGMVLDGRARATGINRPAMDVTAMLVVNAHHDVVNFRLPAVTGGTAWRCLLDTNVPDGAEDEAFEIGAEYTVTGRSLLLFALEPDSGTPIALRRAARALRRLNEAPPVVPAAAEDAPGEVPPRSAGRSADR
jgi:glycogen operon protein